MGAPSATGGGSSDGSGGNETLQAPVEIKNGNPHTPDAISIVLTSDAVHLEVCAGTVSLLLSRDVAAALMDILAKGLLIPPLAAAPPQALLN